MNISNIATFFIWFIIYSFIGWLWETTLISIQQRRFVNRGFLNGPYCPIYGCGSLIFILTTNEIANPVYRFVVGGFFACILEYVTSWALETIYHARWWDYSPRRFNVNGRICLAGFIAFGIGAVIIPYAHQFIAAITDNIESSTLNIIAATFFILVAIDLIYTSCAIAKFNEILSTYQKNIDRRRTRFLKFIRRGRRVFEMRIGKNQRVKNVLSFQQRRILAAFPRIISTRYNEALTYLRRINADSKHDVITFTDEKSDSKPRHRR